MTWAIRPPTTMAQHSLRSTSMCSNASASVFGFPVELGQHILSFCHPWDVAAFSQTCRAAFTLIYQATDQYLWCQLYVNQFDVPKPGNNPMTTMREKYEWKDELIRRMRVELALFRGPVREDEQKAVFEALITIINELSPSSHTNPRLTVKWLKRMILESRLLSNLYSQPESEEYEELHARLRSCLAMTLNNQDDKRTYQLLQTRRDLSRAYVYDLRNYHANNKWGPFKTGGSIDWIHVEHLINVTALNIRDLPGDWANTRPPSCLDRPRFPSLPPAEGGSFNDWAGVVGTWRRYVCFMDYRDLYAFNFTDLADGPRSPKFFRDPFREATRLIEVKTHLVASNQMRYHRLPEGSGDASSRFPPLCFSGSSKGVNGNEAAVEGYVVMGKDGIPRWQLTSIYDGHAQWSSTGVQIGGVKSAMGVVGVWTTTHHDQDDPVGPFWLWKVEDNSPTHLMEFT